MVVLRIFVDLYISWPFFLFGCRYVRIRANLCNPSDRGNQAEALRPPAPTPPRTQQQQVVIGPSSAKGKKIAG